MTWLSRLRPGKRRLERAFGPNVIPLRRRAPIKKTRPRLGLIAGRVILGAVVLLCLVYLLWGQ